MERRNIIGIDARRGFRTLELYEGDVTDLGCSVDALVVSAFGGGYSPIKGTVQGSLQERLGVSLKDLQRSPEFDFRSSLGIWISSRLPDYEFARILCVELVGGSVGIDEALKNVFVGLLILEAKGIVVRSVALPILGAGNQQLDA
jgi:hypothetical protein